MRIFEKIRQLLCNHNFEIIELGEDLSKRKNEVKVVATFKCSKCGKVKTGIISFEKV